MNVVAIGQRDIGAQGNGPIAGAGDHGAGLVEEAGPGAERHAGQRYRGVDQRAVVGERIGCRENLAGGDGP